MSILQQSQLGGSGVMHADVALINNAYRIAGTFEGETFANFVVLGLSAKVFSAKSMATPTHN